MIAFRKNTIEGTKIKRKTTDKIQMKIQIYLKMN